MFFIYIIYALIVFVSTNEGAYHEHPNRVIQLLLHESTGNNVRTLMTVPVSENLGGQPHIDVRTGDTNFEGVEVTLIEGSRQNISETSIRPLVQLGSKSYYFGTFYKANYFEASQYCNYHRMRLVTIESSEENDLLVNHMRKSYSDVDNFWTSGTDLTEEGHFVWLSTGKRFSFTNWHAGQPDNAGKVENCVEIWKINNKYNWNDRPCDGKFYFICELLD